MATSITVHTVHGAQYQVHQNRIAGLVTGTLGNHNLPAYRAYEFTLPNTLVYFHLPNDLNPYNMRYDKAVQLFENTPGGFAKRSALLATFAATFLNRPYSTTSGEITTGDDLLRLIQYGKRGGYDRIFDFSLTMEGVMRMAEASTWGMRDMASKHSVLAQGERVVLYAGTIMVQNGDTLVISNDSGTYAPRDEGLEKLANLLRSEFEGLKVLVLSHQDPRYEELRKTRLFTVADSVGHALKRLWPFGPGRQSIQNPTGQGSSDRESRNPEDQVLQ